MDSFGGKPGDKIFVRKIKSYQMTGSCNVISVPTPNMIAESGFIIMAWLLYDTKHNIYITWDVAESQVMKVDAGFR